MTSMTILILFFVFFTSEFIASFSLNILNINSSIKNCDTIPPFISDFINKEKYSKSVQYSLRKERFTLLTSGLSAAVTAIAVLTGFPALVDNWLNLFAFHPYIHGIVFLLILTALSSLISLPVTLYSQFVIEEEYGFNKMTGKTFILDMIKSTILSLVLFIPLMAALFLFVDKTGEFWWLYAFIFFAAFQLIISLLYPLVIAPIFNKFTDLEEGPLKEKLIALAAKTSFKAKGIYIMDGSRRSSHSNAYFTGFGKSRRIVLFDTLVNSLSIDEIEGVLAHEIGHFKKKHILKSLVSSLFLALLLFYLLSVLSQFVPLFNAFKFSEPSFHSLLVILSFCMGPFSFFIKPFFTMKSRKNEYEADKFAVEITGSADPLKNALINLGKENLSNLTPHPMYSFFHYSHPVLSERIKAMEKK
jgi:STE24 endopeptidase